MPELLAPAGDLERVKTALYFGADAVYAGGPKLQLRSDNAGFTMEELAEAASLAHARGKKLYVAVNSFVKNSEIALLGDYARALKDIGADAVIVSDLGAIATIAREAPDIDIHVSTQANCLNYAAARHYHDMGAKRVILAREATLEEIGEICVKTPRSLEIECFIHGAMCMSYSGRCMLSAYMKGRSANRGDCFQPCRYRYQLSTVTDAGEYYPVYESDEGTMILSSRDLNTMPFLDDIIRAGVTSLKIEGRMKTAYYVATVVNAYRHRIDGTAPADVCLRELDYASHREYTTGFYFGEAKNTEHAGESYLQDKVFTGIVLDAKDGRILVQMRNPYAIGDALEVLSPDSMGRVFTVERIENEDGEPVPKISVPMQKAWVTCPFDLHTGDILRK